MGHEEMINKPDNSEKNATNITSYKMRPSLGETFKGSKIKEIIREVMFEKLQGKTYNTEEVKDWIRDIADSINAAIKDRVVMPRYKYVVQVMLGQQLGAGCHYYCKCCWDAESDSQTSDVYTNTSLFCVTTVFGVYLY
ncbi:dynein light chain Tctex-type protein 2B [Cochliomyia hominivorax]